MSNKEKYNLTSKPLWFEKIEEEFFSRLQRPLDIVHLRYYSIQTRHMSLTRSTKYIQDDLLSYSKQVETGKKQAKKSTIVIAGLLQNAAFHIPSLIQRCQTMVSDFRDYRIVIVENNSTDDSRKYLLEWAVRDPKVIILCNDPFITQIAECDISSLFVKSGNADEHSPFPSRIQRMSYLRNIYLEHIKHYYSHFTYLCVMDMDLQGNLFLDGFYHSIYLLQENKKIDGITGNGMILLESDNFYYYDSFAHIEDNEPIMWENTSDKSQHDNYVHTHITHRYSSQMIHDKVRSAFGGIAIYTLTSIKKHKNKYDFSSNYYSCEHAFFHTNLNIWVNPRFLFLITKNG